jgi:uncharacterized membrane protein
MAWRAAIVLLTLQIALTTSLRYFAQSEAPPPPILANAFANPFLILHVISAVTALLLGPLQFVRGIRVRMPALHRATGRIYVLACAIGAPTGLVLALGTTAGPVAAVGFAIPAILWAAFTYLGVRAAVRRRFDAHRQWMLRSYAMTTIAITLRVMLPVSGALGFAFLDAYRVIAWLCWLTNLALVELYLHRSRALPTATTRLATA